MNPASPFPGAPDPVPGDADEARALRAPDLSPSEGPLVAWFEGLDRPTAPAGLRTRVLGRPRGTAAALVHAVPLGGWGLASAAILLVAFLVVASVEWASPSAAPSSGAVAQGGSPVTLVEDPSLALYHDMEIFDEVGLDRGELIADWGR